MKSFGLIFIGNMVLTRKSLRTTGLDSRILEYNAFIKSQKAIQKLFSTFNLIHSIIEVILVLLVSSLKIQIDIDLDIKYTSSLKNQCLAKEVYFNN